MKKIVLTLLLCCLFGCTITRWVRYGDFTIAVSPAWLYRVNYGYEGDKLVFVMFTSGQYSAPAHIQIRTQKKPSGETFCSGTINLPDGRVFDVASAPKGFEVIGGKITEFDMTMSKTDLERFLKSRPEHYTYAEFKKFLRKN